MPRQLPMRALSVSDEAFAMGVAKSSLGAFQDFKQGLQLVLPQEVGRGGPGGGGGSAGIGALLLLDGVHADPEAEAAAAASDQELLQQLGVGSLLAMAR